MNRSQLNIHKATGSLPDGYAKEFIIVAGDHPSTRQNAKKYDFAMIATEQHRSIGFSPSYAYECNPAEKRYSSGLSGTIETIDGREQISAYCIRPHLDNGQYAANAKDDLVRLATFLEIGVTNKVMLNLEAGQPAYAPEANAPVAKQPLTPLEIRAMQPLVAKPDLAPPPKISCSLGKGQQVSSDSLAAKSKTPAAPAAEDDQCGPHHR